MVIDYAILRKAFSCYNGYFLSEAEIEIRSQLARTKLLKVVKWPSAMIDVSARRSHIATANSANSALQMEISFVIRKFFWIQEDRQLYFLCPHIYCDRNKQGIFRDRFMFVIIESSISKSNINILLISRYYKCFVIKIL